MHAARLTGTGPELPRLLVVVVGVAAGFLVVAGLRGLSEMVGPVFLALVLTLAAQPIRAAAERHGIPGWIGSAAAIIAIYVGLLGFTVAMTWAVARFATLLPTYEDEANEMVDSAVSWLGRMGVDQSQVQEALDGLDLGRVVELAGNLVSGVLGLLSGLFLIVTLVLFMVADAAGFTEKLRRLPSGHESFTTALMSFGVQTRRYLVVSTVFGLIVAVLDTVALAWLGVPVAMLWGLLSFITNYIPNIGFVIGLIPPAIIGLLEGGPRLMIYVVIAYSLLNVVVQTIIQPKIVGDVVGLSTTITMLSLVFWAYTLGTVGALLAVPLTLFVKAVLVDADPRSHWVIPLISGGSPEKPVRQWGSRGPKARREPREPEAPRPEEAR